MKIFGLIATIITLGITYANYKSGKLGSDKRRTTILLVMFLVAIIITPIIILSKLETREMIVNGGIFLFFLSSILYVLINFKKLQKAFFS